MNLWLSSRLTINLVLTLLFLSACTESTPPPAPSLTGYLIVESGANIYRLSDDSKSKTASELRITNSKVQDVRFFDRHQLLYSANGKTLLYDIGTREEKTLLSGSFECISIKDDILNYVSGPELYVYNLSTRKSTLVFRAPSASYGPAGLVELGVGGQLYFGAVTCGTWIGDNRMLFQRFVGSMPSQITINAPGLTPHELYPNTTTLAELDHDLVLLDLNRQLFVRSIFEDGSYILFEENGELYINQFLGDINSVSTNARRIPIDRAYQNTISLRPGSNEIYYQKENQLYFIDLGTLKERPGPNVPYDWFQWIWVGDPNDNMIAGVETDKYPVSISITDLNTGGRTGIVEGTLAEELSNNSPTYPRLVGWFPE